MVVMMAETMEVLPPLALVAQVPLLEAPAAALAARRVVPALVVAPAAQEALQAPQAVLAALLPEVLLQAAALVDLALVGFHLMAEVAAPVLVAPTLAKTYVVLTDLTVAKVNAFHTVIE